MSEFLVNSQDLTSVADAIRAKGETQAPLVFPNGFISAIDDISTGIDPAILSAITDNGTNFDHLFYNRKNLVHAPELDTSNAITALSMFYNCSKLQDTPQYDFRNLETADSMFYNCSRLRKINVKNTGKVKSFNSFAHWCTGLTDRVINLDTTSATSMSSMFDSTSIAEVHLTDTSKVTNMSYAFYSCANLVTIETLDFSSCQSTYGFSAMFMNDSKLTNIAIVENSLSLSGLSFTTKLLTDKSYEYIANALNPNVTGKTIGLIYYSETEARLKSLMGTNDNGHFTLDSNGDISVFDFILNVKGWSIVR